MNQRKNAKTKSIAKINLGKKKKVKKILIPMGANEII